MMDRTASPSWSEVIAGYWRHMARAQAAWPQQRDDETDFWAWEAVDSVFSEGAPAAIEKLVQLADVVPDRALLNYLGGGPLEDLVQFWGAEYEEEIVAAARRSSNFAAALRTVHPTPNALVLWERIGAEGQG
jgi:hypothetical protein